MRGGAEAPRPSIPRTNSLQCSTAFIAVSFHLISFVCRQISLARSNAPPRRDARGNNRSDKIIWTGCRVHPIRLRGGKDPREVFCGNTPLTPPLFGFAQCLVTLQLGWVGPHGMRMSSFGSRADITPSLHLDAGLGVYSLRRKESMDTERRSLIPAHPNPDAAQGRRPGGRRQRLDSHGSL